MKILFATSEAYPLVKTGGLGDVSRALPQALKQHGEDVRILLPGYPSVLSQLSEIKEVCVLSPTHSFQESGRLVEALFPGSDLPLYVVESPGLYDRPGTPYLTPEGHDWPDNALRFGYLSHVAALICSGHLPMPWKPDIVHCNDWQTALVPVFLAHRGLARFPSVLTIHNLAFQGNFSPDWVQKLGFPTSSFHMEDLEFYGHFSFLKAGLVHATRVTTVSPTYAREICSSDLGYGLQGLLSHREKDLMGILNGIGPEWNPSVDPLLQAHFSVSDLRGKTRCKNALRKQLQLPVTPNVPVLGLVSRLTHQKGIDLLVDILDELMNEPLQLVILGSGDASMEQTLREAQPLFPEKLSVTLGFDEALSHRIIAGSDLFLMPSRFEPCGLAQMYAMAYGSPPVVHKTGGLADTVEGFDFNGPAKNQSTGFVFEDLTPQAFMNAIRSGLSQFQNKNAWQTLRKNGMKKDFSWTPAGAIYTALYKEIALPS